MRNPTAVVSRILINNSSIYRPVPSIQLEDSTRISGYHASLLQKNFIFPATPHICDCQKILGNIIRVAPYIRQIFLPDIRQDNQQNIYFLGARKYWEMIFKNISFSVFIKVYIYFYLTLHFLHSKKVKQKYAYSIIRNSSAWYSVSEYPAKNTGYQENIIGYPAGYQKGRIFSAVQSR